MNKKKNLLVDYVEQSALKYPDNISYEFMGSKKTYSEFVQQINSAAKALVALGVKEDDVVCVVMPNVPQAIIMIYAANKIGAAVNMIHPLSSENELLDFANRVSAKVMLILDQFYEKLKAVEDRTKLEKIIIAGIGEVLPPLKKIGYKLTQARKINCPTPSDRVVFWKDFLKAGEKIDKLPQISDRGNKVALILHSGGTTGVVKGVCLSNNSVNDAAQQMIDSNPMMAPEDRFLSVMPIFHGNGLVVGIHAMQVIGARCVLIPRFTPKTYAKDLLKHKCNYMSGVPALYEKLMEVDVMQKADLSFLKAVISGADYLSVELERRINKFLKDHNANVNVRQGYGMTEGVVATTLNPYDYQKEGSIGKAFNGVDAKIVEPGTDKELPYGEVGEIVFSSTTNMLYYYNNPEETAATLKLHSDGKYWVHSGDLGTEDSDGFFYFKGRIKRMIVKNGYNIFPNELENVIEGFEMVDRCCVLGVQNETATTRIKAFIILKNGYSKSDETKTEILELCKKSIAKYALPKEIEFIDEMPKTKVGKVDYNALLKAK